jgi:hypothetical protein
MARGNTEGSISDGLRVRTAQACPRGVESAVTSAARVVDNQQPSSNSSPITRR